ncbi:MAG: TraR/DksA family transcriptional regulator [Patescibacteria group bacterium]
MAKVASPLTPEFIEKMKVILLEDRVRLKKELAKYGTRENEGPDKEALFPDYGNSEEDNALEVADYEANLSLETDLTKSLRDVESSLARIEKGTYGICKYCGKPIAEKRLLARPTSSADISCKKTIVQEA